MITFATDSSFIISFNDVDTVFYDGFSGGTGRDTRCLFSYAQHGRAL